MKARVKSSIAKWVMALSGLFLMDFFLLALTVINITN
jgi:hypothetical protein